MGLPRCAGVVPTPVPAPGVPPALASNDARRLVPRAAGEPLGCRRRQVLRSDVVSDNPDVRETHRGRPVSPLNGATK